jgi:hypothetical protein
VPVRIVTEDRDVAPLVSSSHRHLTAPVAGSDPIRLCGRNSQRLEMLLLNEDPTHGIRIAQRFSDLNTANSGSLLPAASTGYLRLKTQDELYAVSNDGTAASISVVEIFDKAASEVQ